MPMDLQIAPIGEAELEEVSKFLREIFGCDKKWVPFLPEVLRWKALAPHPLWEGGRGYALRRDGAIVAYGCAAPTRWVYEGGEATVACVVDWAASKAVPGGGVAIYNHIAQLVDALIGVGGSDDAHRVLKRMKFQDRQGFEVRGRVTRPVRRFLDVREKGWKDAARLGRSLWRGMQPVGRADKGWSARQVERFDERIEQALPRPGLVSKTVSYRDAAILNYLLTCPAAQMQGYVIERAGGVMGYCVLAFLHGECRVAELWVSSAEERDWVSALTVAVAGRSGNQLVIGCGTEFSLRVAGRAGFHKSSRQPIYVKDPSGKVPVEMDAAMSMSDTDVFFL
jgi:hypothetical protein